MNKKVIIFGILLILISVGLMLMPLKGEQSKKMFTGEAQIEEQSIPEQGPIVTEDGAIKIVTTRIKNSTPEDIMEFSQEYKNSGWIYEGTIKTKKKDVMYQFQIDGDLGTILQWVPVKNK